MCSELNPDLSRSVFAMSGELWIEVRTPLPGSKRPRGSEDGLLVLRYTTVSKLHNCLAEKPGWIVRGRYT